MFKTLSFFAFSAVIFFASAFSSVAATHENQPVIKENAPKTMTSVTLTQTASGEATGVWAGDGPVFTVVVRDVTTNQLVANFTTSQTSWVFSNLTPKHLYNLSVGDWTVMGDQELITY